MSQYDIIEHMDLVQQEFSLKETDEEKIVFVIAVLDYLVSRDKTLNEDIGKALMVFLQTLSDNVIKGTWPECMERKRLKKSLYLHVYKEENKDFSDFIKNVYIRSVYTK